jgi:hypothetical protein
MCYLSHGMAKFTTLIAVFLFAGCSGSFDGLNNHSKAFTSPRDITPEDWSDPAESERAWQAAPVRIPAADGAFISSQIKELDRISIDSGKSYPTVIYLHGCAGTWNGTFRRINFFASNGFAVIAPASFARKKYAKSCDPAKHKGGLYSAVLFMRQHDAGYAIREARKLPWVDPDNVFLVGTSEGGITTATFYSDNDSMRVNARVIEGWTCNGGWNYMGIKAPESEPVLSLVGDRDPWFYGKYGGDCGRFMSNTNGSHSIVFREGTMRTMHMLMDTSEVKELTIDFLREHLR